VATDLDVALLEHVEQTHLDSLGEVGQLVHGEDATVGAGHEAVVEHELVGQVAALGDLDRIDLADEVGDRGVGGGELLGVALVAMDPRDRRVVAQLLHQVPGVTRDRGVGVVVDLGTRDDRHPFVEELGEPPDHAGLRLAPLTQEDDVVPREQGVLELGGDGVLVAQHVGEQGLPGADPFDGVAPDLLADRDGFPSALAKGTEGLGSGHGATLHGDPVTWTSASAVADGSPVL